MTAEILNFPGMEERRCSFCMKPESTVAKMVTGGNHCVCNECIDKMIKLLRASDGGKTKA